jgi:hypothetical protein
MDSGEKATRAHRTPPMARATGFRLRYINERLKELGAERDRLMEERKALRKSRISRPDETED